MMSNLNAPRAPRAQTGRSMPVVGAVLVTALTLLVHLIAPVSVEAQELNLLKRIDVTTKPERTEVVVQASGEITYSVYRLANPPRIFVDISNAQPAPTFPPVQTDIRNGAVESVHVSTQEDSVQALTRIIVELKNDLRYDVTNTGDTLTLVVEGKTTGSPTEDPELSALTSRLQNAEVALHRKDEQLLDVERELAALERAKTEAIAERSKRKTLQEELAQVRENSAPKAELDDLRRRLNSAEAALIDARRATEGSGTKVSSTLAELKVVNDRLSALQQDLSEERKRADKSSKRLAQTSRELERAHTAQERDRAAYTQLKKRLEQSEAQINDASATSKGLRQELAQTSSKLEDLQSQLAERVKRIELLERTRTQSAAATAKVLGAQQKEIDALKSQRARLESELGALRQSTSSEKAALTGLLDDKRRLTRALEILGKERTSLREDLDDLESELASLRRRQSESKVAFERTQTARAQELDNVRKDQERETRKLAALRIDVESARRDADTAKEKAKDARAEVKRWTSKVDELKAAAKVRTADAKEALAAKDRRIKALEQELKTLGSSTASKTEITRLQASLDKAKAAREESLRAEQKATKEAHSASAKLAELTRWKTKNEEELKLVQSKLETAEKRRKAMRKERDDWRNKANTAKSNVSRSAKEELSAALRRADRAESELADANTKLEDTNRNLRRAKELQAKDEKALREANKTLGDTTRRLEEAKRAAKDKASAVARLEDELRRSKSDLDAANKALSSSGGLVAALEASKAEQRKAEQEARNLRVELNAARSALKGSGGQREEVAKARQELARLKVRFDEESKGRVKAERALDDARSTSDQLRRDKSRLEKENETLKDEEVRLKKAIADSKLELARVQKRVLAPRDNNAQEVESLTRKLARTEERLRVAERRAAEAENRAAQVASLESRVQALESKRKELELALKTTGKPVVVADKTPVKTAGTPPRAKGADSGDPCAGKLSGRNVTLYYSNFNKKAEGLCENGVREGVWVFWGQDGRISKKTEFVGGQAK